jgi:hypothetical protein
VIKYSKLQLCTTVLVAIAMGLYQARAQIDTTRKEFFHFT